MPSSRIGRMQIKISLGSDRELSSSCFCLDFFLDVKAVLSSKIGRDRIEAVNSDQIGGRLFRMRQAMHAGACERGVRLATG